MVAALRADRGAISTELGVTRLSARVERIVVVLTPGEI